MQTQSRAIRIMLAATLALALTACGGGNNGLPASVTVELPDGTAVVSTLGSGVISFADSRWQFFRNSAIGQGAPFATIVFGPNGELAAIEDNTIAVEVLGTSLFFDGAKHPTSQAGLTYAAATFGAETADSQGFAFEGQITAFATLVGEVASGTMTASGEFDGGDINTVTGTFEFSFVLSSLASSFVTLPEGGTSDSFAFIGRRIVE